MPVWSVNPPQPLSEIPPAVTLYDCPINAPLKTRLTVTACRINRLRYEHAVRFDDKLAKLYVRACGSCPGCVALARK